MSGFQLHFAAPPHLHARATSPTSSWPMNPAALRANLEDLPDNGLLIVDQEAFSEQNLKKAGYASNPLTDGSLDRFQTYQVDITRLTTLRAAGERPLDTSRCCRCKNFFTLGLVAVALPAARPSRRPISSSAGSARIAELASTRTSAPSAPASTSARRPSSSRRSTRSAPPRSRRAATATSPATRLSALGLVDRSAPRAGSPLPRLLSDHPGERHPPRARRRTRAFERHHFPGRRTRSPASERRSARPSAAPSRSTTTSGPGIDLKSETIGPRASRTELPLDHHATSSAAARRPGCRPRPSRPTSWRLCTAATASRRSRSSRASTPADCFAIALEAGPDRRQVHDPGDVLLRRLPRRMAPSRGPFRRSRTCPSIDVQFRTDPTGYYPYLRDPETLLAAVGRPRDPGARAPHRRARVGVPDRKHQLRARQPRADGAAARQKIALIAQRDSRRPRSAVPSAAPSSCSAGAAPTARSAPRTEQLQASGKAVAHVHLRYLNPLPPDLGEILRRYDRVLVPEMNMGQLLRLDPGRVPGRRDRLQPDPGAPLQGGRDRRPRRRSSSRRIDRMASSTAGGEATSS